MQTASYKIIGRVSNIPHGELRNTQVLLKGGKYSAVPRTDGSFVIFDVSPGVYSLHVASIGYIFPDLRVEVSAKVPGRVRARFAGHNNRTYVPYPLVLLPEQPAEYFEVNQGFSVRDIMANPMFLMMGFTLLLAFVVPKLMGQLDPEDMKELQETSLFSNPLGGGETEKRMKAEKTAAQIMGSVLSKPIQGALLLKED
eukprot:TRINITY_DN9385_c0_g1_i6.p1 TRINITY_DN9385_c0_g1~~TRINITY_DN9385_c0_g1_i6.p1  ORF type:complete len:218 (+),score=67.37 TRINITY_DN9385_c0_g1_i6:62-655(+)